MCKMLLFTLAFTWSGTVWAVGPPLPVEPVPRPAQMAWQRMELTMFLHFGVNTFNDREWGDGQEDPDLFHPSDLDCRQWAREAKDAGFGMMILTAKHHDGFCLWPTAHTEHCVKRSAWRDGKGDVMREFVDACRAEGLQVGFYLSPWDRHDARYGGKAYNEFFKAQLDELMVQYGPISEVWFDGASKGQITPYDWKGYYDVVYGRNPSAVIAICGPDIRWVGNESGVARPGESSVQEAQKERHFGQRGKVWYPAECDVSIRPGWFYHPAQDARVKSLDHLLDIYFKSVGRNSVLLLNVPPDRRGRLADADVTRLREFRAALDKIFDTNFAAGRPVRSSEIRGNDTRFGPGRAVDGDLDTYWATDDGVAEAWLEVDFGEVRRVNVASVQEYLPLGERIRRYRVELRVDGRWRTVGRGTVIGHKSLLRFPAVEADRLKLVVEEAKACPAICGLGAYNNPYSRTVASGSLAAHLPVRVSNVHPGGTTWGGDKAVDDDMATRWATSDDTRACWLEVDLGASKRLGALRIAELQPRITRFQLEFKQRPEDNWQVAVSGTHAGTDYRTNFDAVEGRFLRLRILDATFAPTIWEFQVFPPPQSPTDEGNQPSTDSG